MADQDAAALERLERWTAELRAREAADARVRERWLRTQAQEDASLAQVLAGLAERRAEVAVTTTAGHQATGTLVAIGADFVALVGAAGRTTLVPMRALLWAREASGGRAGASAMTLGPDPSPVEAGYALGAGGGAGGGSGASLVDVLSHAAANRPRLTLHAQGATLAGELRSVGVDFLAVDTTSSGREGLAYVRLESLSEISLFASG